MPSQAPTLLAFANVQMAAEALLHNHGSQVSVLALTEGNKHASVFPSVLANTFSEEWTVVSHEKNTTTGFSGTLLRYTGATDRARGLEHNQLVMSFRSTEFIDDAVRDNQSTNAMEIKELGWAFGQISDMEKWWARIQPEIGATKVTLTGYSLGGHLATAFQRLHPVAVQGAYTFNGAGVGRVNEGVSLAAVVSQFEQMRQPTADLSAVFMNSEVRALYQTLRQELRGGATLTATQRAGVVALLPPTVTLDPNTGLPTQELTDPDVKLLFTAVARIEAIQKEAVRISSYTSAGNGEPPRLEQVPAVDVAATDLNYQLAALIAARSTSSVSLATGVVNTILDGRSTVEPPVPGFFDVFGATFPSAVANSQLHYGTATPVFIEDQPLYRGTVLGDAWNETRKAGEVKLLVNGYVNNDFGDTHSLVLLVDSLSVQTVFTTLDPEIAQSTLNRLLTTSSNARASHASGTQGKADGNTLEFALDSLRRQLGPMYHALWPRWRGTHGGLLAIGNDFTRELRNCL